jgi:hypothetical protein
MMNEPGAAPPMDPALEIRRIRRMLKQMYGMAESASLTGAFREGAQFAGEQYNAIRSHLLGLGVLSAGPLFPQLTGEMTWGRVAIACRMMEGYLTEEGPPRGGEKVILDSLNGLEDLKDLGRTIRDNLPEFLHRRAEEARAAAAEEAHAATEEAQAAREEEHAAREEMRQSTPPHPPGFPVPERWQPGT